MGVGSAVMYVVSPILESIAPYAPGEVFPHFFSGLFQNALVASILVTIVAGFPVTIADSLLLFLLEGHVQFLQAAIIAFCQHGHVDSLCEGHTDTSICRES